MAVPGFASIVIASEAIKLGACNYLAKPSNTDDIEAAFTGDPGPNPLSCRWQRCRPRSRPLEMERIHDVLAETGFNISETARRLGMHRRTLARTLAERWVPQE